jgi:preprotein translocase subunit SecG
MANILINIFTVVLILISVFLVLLVLMQKAKSDGGVGAAMGGGMAEATFGAETGNILTGATIKATIAFFVLSFGLYLAQIYQHKHGATSGDELPSFTAPAATPAPALESAPVPESAPAAEPTPAQP